MPNGLLNKEWRWQILFDGVVKILHLLRCYKIYIITTYSSTLK